MRVRTLLATVVGILILGNPARAADDEKARLAAHHFKEVYWQCLADETVRNLGRNMSGPDFVIYLKGRCPDQLKQFRIAFIDYLAIKHPDVPMAMHFTAAEQVISAAVDDAASAYVD